MDAISTEVRLGFSRFGDDVLLSREHIRGGVAVIGKGAEIASLLALSLHESGERVLVLDLSGGAARGLSGYIRTFDSGYVMKDAFKIEEEGGQFHAQLVASALSTIFNLPSTQESILNSILTSIAIENGYASPGAIFDAANLVGGFKATDKEEVEGKLGSLQLLNATGELGSINEVTEHCAVLSFSSLPTPELAEAGAAFVLAKVLATHRDRGVIDSLVIFDAHRIFRAQRTANHSRRLHNYFMSSRLGKIFATELANEIDERVTGNCSVRIVSSSVWNELDKKDKLLAGSFMLQDISSGVDIPFVPRRFWPKSGHVKLGPPPVKASTGLTIQILETIAQNELSTKASVSTWLSIDYDTDEIRTEIDHLVRELFVVVIRPEPTRESSGGVLKLTALGEEELKRLRKNGETGNPL